MKRFAIYTIWLSIIFAIAGCGSNGTSSSSQSSISLPADTLSVTPNSLSLPASSSQNTLTISSNTQWTLTHNADDWLNLSATSGSGSAQVTVTANTNTTARGRFATITVRTEQLSQSITVTQDILENSGLTGEFDVPPVSDGMSIMTAVELTQQMGVGWNAGNSLDAIGGETAWGNPTINRQLISSIKSAGFNSIRLPVAWSQFSDENNFVIRAEWMNRVEEVVNYALDEDLYVLMNIHWDGGWMQPTNAEADYVNNRLAVMWKQIAERFRDYDHRLLFAGTNEVMVEGDWGTPTPEYYTVQNGFNKTFIDTVRKTGGRNAYRYLVIQGFNTNIDHTVNFAVVPQDVVSNRLLMEVHYYDPYNFTLNGESTITQWGNIATNANSTETWANENYVDSQFQRMKTSFVDKGVGVILGEYGVISRLSVSDHETYREYWNRYITESAVQHQMVPMYWDNGFAGDQGMALFDRNNGAQLYPNIINAIVGADD